MERLIALSAQMAREGIRRLLVISGEETWCQQQATALIAPQAALWVGDEQDAAQAADYCHPRALTTLLGREFSHAVFDARRGFDVAAFAALGGTLRAGGWLILLTPPFSRWAETPDADACRWSDTAQPISTPRFISHVCRMLRTHDEAILWQQGEPLTLPEFAVRPTWHPASGAPEQEQAAILAELHAMSPGVMVVTAPRGRGKSALAGMHLRHLHGNAIVTAPTRAATDVLAQFAGEEVNFVPPDTLRQRLADGDTSHPDWLIVDEAAAIP
ncbi:tRNA(Met) cytidine acetyltransferase TmcA domain-containing protein, partial [Pseudescherichia sp.]|uniref:tRNA(Met) cytidine acetyltransferase TmcA domain-containing protein n=1 Tax=Pseudescherichia sp. TaxID=2055881 RepID=UPI0028B05E4D